MAPEQCGHPADVDHRADIYSLGVVFYQMLTGELPGAKLEPPSKKVVIDVCLDEVVLRALAQKPERRYRQVSEIKTMCATLAQTAPAAERSPGGAADANVAQVDLDRRSRDPANRHVPSSLRARSDRV
jgi:serine/threonine protein kinase